MARRKRLSQPLTLRIDRLELKGSSGVDASGKRWTVRGAAVGETVSAWPGRKATARIINTLETPVDQVEPECAIFGVCGGCQFQRMSLEQQRVQKQEVVSRSIGDTTNVTCHAMAGTSNAYEYRNKLELSFGPRVYVAEADKDNPDIVREGSFLGFHPRGWYSRIVPVQTCPLATDPINRVIDVINRFSPAPPWDNKTHTGDWRHVVIRHGDGVLVSLVTSSSVQPDQVRTLGKQIGQIDDVVGVVWIVTDRLSDVAQGTPQEVLYGNDWLHMSVGKHQLRLPHDGFFQVNTAGALLLFEQIRDALRPNGSGTLLDLYCGVGAIGMALADDFTEIIGIELNPASIECAKNNAIANGIESTWLTGKVEKILPTLSAKRPRWIVVDPPRAGLHPAAAQYLAKQHAQALVYVACNPASLGRDRLILEAGNWRLDEVWPIDLFPQTPHVEVVARFVPTREDGHQCDEA